MMKIAQLRKLIEAELKRRGAKKATRKEMEKLIAAYKKKNPIGKITDIKG